MGKVVAQTSLFVGSWDEFSLRFPQKAQEYKQELSIAHTQNIVLYVPPSFEGKICLTDYALLFSLDILNIIIIVDTRNPVIFEELSFEGQSLDQLMHIILCQGAECLYMHQLSPQEDKIFVRTTITTLYSSASFNYCVLYAGNASITHYYDSFIRGSHAESLFNGVYCATGKQNIMVFSAMHHYAPHAKSDVLVKGVVAQRAHVVYKGFIFIDTTAHDTDASQENGTLIVGDHGSIESVPVLEVLNNEVRCTHASAVGRLDEHHIMYLRSRGYSLADANRTIIQSYLFDVFTQENVVFLQKEITLIINLLSLV